ncbi:MAG: alkaline phosphatase family protein [Candidatus Cloacimonetes bacterium]|nr:alkaline phosphatase family protein [Candidatus Cloacimonadota bacterium]
MKKDITIFMFIDAMGWEVLKGRTFLEELLPYRQPVGMQFGYSCTAIPTILTGERPAEHKHLSFYYYNPEDSPFKMFKNLGLHYLPSVIMDRWRVRHQLSKIVKKMYNFTGYFEMYAMPFNRLHYFDYIEKTDLFVAGGLSPTPNLADLLVKNNVPHSISNWRLTEEQNIEAMIDQVKQGDIRFAFLYTAAMDGLLHRVTKDGKEIQEKLDWYAGKVEKLVSAIKEHYEDYSLFLISDHGMTTLTGTQDVKGKIEGLGLEFGKDYVAVYDSTMARFWYFNDKARTIILEALAEIPQSSILDEEYLRKHGVWFEDKLFGETYLLMEPGVQIEPCDMGRKALAGMHGFAPEHPDSMAAFLGSEPINDQEINWVGDYFKVMKSRIEKIAAE